jgi:hypothetical protein
MSGTLSKLFPVREAFDWDAFRDPPAPFRGAPFWAWNNRLDRAQLLRQISAFAAMGMGGFHIHPRTGLETPYLSPAFFSEVRHCVEEAERRGMRAWLYDEDRWPSGFAGGMVTRDHRFRAKHLRFTRLPSSLADQNKHAQSGILLARYEVVLASDGCLQFYKKLLPDETPSQTSKIWHAYLENTPESPWYNYQTYVDTLNREAILRFIQVTHEAYASEVGNHFGKTIPAIFTDEPQFVHKSVFSTAYDERDLIIPFTANLFETYRTTYRQDLAEVLPEIFWELPNGQVSVARYRYHDHLCERFTQAFADTLGSWCEEHGLALTGHMMEEQSLQSQTAALGEAMRSYRSFQLPGIDILCDHREYTTAKQAQSAARQYGRPGILSELYGVTNWDFSFCGHKAQGDWQAALGVVVRVHHLTMVSMAGEAKRDYPASIGYQSPWHQEYREIEDHFARLNTVLTRGAPRVRVAVIHPIESYWLAFGPLGQTSLARDTRERMFQDLTRWLLFGLIDFDFICESLLPSQCQAHKQSGPLLVVGKMSYDAVIVPGLRTIRSTTLDRLEAFADAGGDVLFAGEVPALVDAAPSKRPRDLAAQCRRVEFHQAGVMDALAPYRELMVHRKDGASAGVLLSQVRDEGAIRYVFLCNTERAAEFPDATISMKGSWRVTRLDTSDGSSQVLQSRLDGEWTRLQWSVPGCGSLLLMLERGWQAGGAATAPSVTRCLGELAGPVPVKLSEPNVLLLDQAEWRIDRGGWQPKEEILRIDNAVRQELGLPVRTGKRAQPWTDDSLCPILATVELRWQVEALVHATKVEFAVEAPESLEIHLNQRHVTGHPAGWWVDESIRRVPLGDLKPGSNELHLIIPFHRRTELEWCYLLGDFGVEVAGRHARLCPFPGILEFGDWTHQGLPFYAGNVTYDCTLQGHGDHGETILRLPKFKAPLIAVAVDGRRVGTIAHPPYELNLGTVSHRLELTAFGNRINAFGAVHNADDRWSWWGPSAYRTDGDAWAYEYQLRPMGILTAPRIFASAKGHS